MHVHTIKVSFSRKRKPADYEGCDTAAELTATLEEGEDYRLKLREIADEAAIVVYNRIGMPTHAKPVFDVHVEAGVAVATEAATPTAPAAAPAADGKKSRGRPAMTEEEKAAAKAARDAEKAAADKAAADAAKIAASKTEPQIRTNPENRVDPSAGIPEETPAKAAAAPAKTAATDGIPDEAPAPKAAAAPAKTASASAASGGVSESELQTFVQLIVVEQKKIEPIAMRAIFQETAGVQKMQEIKDDATRAKVRDAINKKLGIETVTAADL